MRIMLNNFSSFDPPLHLVNLLHIFQENHNFSQQKKVINLISRSVSDKKIQKSKVTTPCWQCVTRPDL